jgi:hypothetical protein
MQKLAVGMLLAMGLVMVGCGMSNGSSGNINGNWTATLTDTNNNPAISFTTSIAQSSNGSLSVTNLHFSTNSPCFVSGETATGAFSLSGNFDGNVSGSFGMNVVSGSPGGNTLTMNGTMTGNAITGNWTLMGSSGCSGSGHFTMTRM